jgi:hypothetical protein
MAKDNRVNIEIDVKGTPALKSSTKAIKEHDKALKQQGQTTQKTGKKARTYYQRQEKGVIGVANQTKSFSKMQQTMDGGGGAGGLVRAYALLAANVFALSMAFGVLSRSAQVDTLTQAMERLEVVSGKAIRGLARDLQEASGYGMDFADSMRATSLALSAGFDSSTVQELAEVARNASVSLGRNMADGLDRIFRGVIKVEPELLDEIGLFVRVREAAARYASELGIAASDLTEFQRRQAFANEALRQGKEKFAAFSDIETDPFSQLAARFSDIAQSLMSMLNKVIVPFINLLMSSKAVLMAVFLGIAAALLKKAIPAMGIMNRSNAELAETARKNHAELMSGIDTEAREIMEASVKKHQIALQTIKDNEDIAKSRQKAMTGSGKFGMGKSQGGKQAEKDYKTAVKAKSLDGQRNALIAKRNALDKSSEFMAGRKEKWAKENIKTIGYEKAAITKVINKLDEEIYATQEIVRINKELESSIVKQGELLDRQEKKLANKELQTKGLASITNVAETKGMNAAMQEFGRQSVIVKGGLQGMNKWTKFFSMSLFGLKGAFSIAAVGAQTLMMALGPIMMVISILVPIFMGLLKLMGFFSKEAEAVTDAQKNLEEQTDMLSKKLAHQRDIYRDNTSTALNWLDAMLAQKIATKEVMESVIKLEEAQVEYAKSSNFLVKGWNWAWDGFKDFMAGTISMIETEEFGVRIQYNMRDLDANKTQEILNSILGDPDNVSKAMQDYLNSFNIEDSMFVDGDFTGGNLREVEIKIQESLSRIDTLKKQIKEGDYAGGIGLKEDKEEMEKLEKGLHRLNTTQMTLSFQRAKAFKDAGIETKKLLELQDREIAGEENLKSIRQGANDALREFRDKFITKTDVDKPLASFSQLITGLNIDKEKMVVSDKALADSLKAIVQEESAEFKLLSKDRQEAFKLAMGFIKGVDGAPDVFNLPNFVAAEDILKEQQASYSDIQKTIIRNKQELKNIATQEKILKKLRKESILAIEQSYKLEKLKRDILLEQEKITLRTALLGAGVSESIAEELFDTGQIDALMTHMKDEGLDTAKSHSVIVKLLQLQNIELQAEVEEATRSLRLDKERTELALKRVKLAEKLSAEEAKGLKMARQLKAFKETGTTKLTGSQELLSMIETEEKRMEKAKERHELEKKIIGAKYNILIAEWDLLKAQAAETDRKYLTALKASAIEEQQARINAGIIGEETYTGPATAEFLAEKAKPPTDYSEDRSNLEAAADLEVEILEQAYENAADTFAVALRTKVGEALTQAFVTDIIPVEETSLYKLIQQLDVASVFKKQLAKEEGVLTSQKEEAETELGGIRTKVDEGVFTKEDIDRANELNILLAEIQMNLDTISTEQARNELGAFTSMLHNFAASVNDLGPGGAFAATFAEFGAGMLQGFQTMQNKIADLSDDTKTYIRGEEETTGADLEKAKDAGLNIMTAAEAKTEGTVQRLQMASSAISGLASLMAAKSAQKVAGIDNEINAEKKRDGKSKESLAKIKQLEIKKDKIQRKAFEKNKKMQMATTIINTATTAMKMFAEHGYPGLIAALAMGAAQLAIIASTQYQSTTSTASEGASPDKIEVGKRTNKVDVSQQASAGELAYLRGERGIGTSATSFTPTGGAAGLRKGYAGGGSLLVGERGAEEITPLSPMQVWPAGQGAKSQINANFTIHAIDAVGVEEVLMGQQGNIINMIRSAANDYGTEFLEEIDTTTYGDFSGGGDY